jgi:LemA protein
MSLALILGIGIPLLVVILLARYIYKTYNELTYRVIKVDKQSSNIDAHLKKKIDLIPALVEVVKGYAKHEKGTFQEVTSLRSQWGKTESKIDKVKTANQIESLLSKILLIQESYPQLKADKRFRDIQKSMSQVEKELVHERKHYNEKVRRYNTRVRLFPKNIVAKLFGFRERPFYSMEE